MIPLAVVTGFLGSGKTSYLRHIVERNHHRRLAYIVNEFGSVDIDGQLLDCPSDSLISIPGGSIFCKCLVSGFIHHLQNVRQLDNIEGVVIEASGIADPRVVSDMLRETRLDQDFTLSTVIAVVDPGTFEILLQTLPNISSQVEAADTAILNKTDIFPEEKLVATENAIRQINSEIRIVRGVYARVDSALFDSLSEGKFHGSYAECADPNYARACLKFSEPINPSELQNALKELGAYRVKGFIPGPNDVCMLIDATATQFSCTPHPAPSSDSVLVLIVPGGKNAELQVMARNLGASLLD